MNPLLYILPLPYAVAIALWWHSMIQLRKRRVTLREVNAESATHLRLLPVALIGALLVTATYPLLVQTGRGGLPAVLLLSGLSAIFHIYLIYVALFHWLWVLSALFRPTSETPSEAMRLSFARSNARRGALTAALVASAILLILQILVIMQLASLRAQLAPGSP